MFLVVDIIIALCGCYVIGQYLIMKKTGKLRESPLFPKGLDVKKCKDVQGYISYMGVRQLVFGIVAVLGGVVGAVGDCIGLNVVGTVSYLISMCVFLACAIWYGSAMKKASKMYW